MKKILLFMVAVLLVFGMVSCDQEVKTKTYKVSYNANGAVGNVPATIEVEEGGTTTVPSCGSLSMKGYDFVGWNTKKDGSGKTYEESQFLKVDSDISLYAQWSIHEYSISYDLGGGSYPEGRSNPKTYTIETENFTLNNPEKDGYEFLGWKTSENDEPSKNVSSDQGNIGDLSFTAVWRHLESHSISYDVNGGEGSIGTVLKLEGESAEIATASEVSRRGYGFVCWNTESDGTGKDYNPGYLYEEDADLQLYAKWSIVKYSIEYNLNDGKLATGKSNPDEYTVETADIVLENPTKHGYEFVGWRYKDDSDALASTNFSIKRGTTGNLSIVAVWKALGTYTISYDANGGTGTIETQSEYKGTSLTISSGEGVERVGYIFSCWNTKKDGTGKEYKPNDTYSAGSDLRLYAKWNPIKYSITYDLDGGNFSDGSSITEYTIETDTFTLPIPTKAEYEFVGWTAGIPDEAQKTVSVEKGSTGNLSFTAVWRKLNRYTVSYDANGGFGSIESQSKLEGFPMTISDAVGLERVGYSFVCWNTKSDGTGMDYKPSDEYTNDAGLVLYAKWSVVKYSITYDLAGGTLPEGKSNPSGYTIETETFTLVNPGRTGYEFLGWRESSSKDEAAEENVSIANGSIGNRSFTAVWEAAPLAYTYLFRTKSYSVKCTDKNISSVTIPSMYKGTSVTEIADSAFEGCSSLTEITIPPSVTSIGGSAFSGCSGLTEMIIPLSVTSIGGSAFSDCSGLTEMVIPSSVTSIGECAFKGCRNLSIVFSDGMKFIPANALSGASGVVSVFIPSSVESIEELAFGGCNGLASVTIPEGVTFIGRNAFCGCRGLTEVTIPSSVTIIMGGAFSECENLSIVFAEGSTEIPGFYDSRFYPTWGCSGIISVTIPEGVTRIGANAFNGFGISDITIPSSVVSISSSAFYNCENLSVVFSEGLTKVPDNALKGTSVISVTIPSSITSIGECAFAFCKALSEITIPKNVKSIGESAFYGCNNLSIVFAEGMIKIPDKALDGAYYCVASVTIPSSVESIGDATFAGCNGLTDITIPEGVTSIGAYAFSGCWGLTHISIPSSVTSMGSSIFNGCKNLSVVFADGMKSIPANALSDASGVVSVVIPSSVTSIGDFAFRDCSGLTEITIPSGVTNIGWHAFSGCGSLSEMTIPSSVTSIGGFAFRDCSGLAEMIIPSSVTNIGEYAFNGCRNLSVVFSEGMKSIPANALSGASGISGCVISSSVTNIGKYAFKGCKGLSKMTIPEGVESIGDYAFSDCGDLTEVVLPSSSKNIGSYAFYGCKNLVSIIYSFPKFKWNYVTKSSNWDLETGNYTIHCTDADIVKN